MYEIKKIPQIPCATVIGLLSGSGFFVWALLSVLVDWARVAQGGMGTGLGMPGYWVEVGFNITVFPLLALALGFVAGFLISGLYNIWAKYIGGIEIDLKLTKEK
ncbi:MAG TPA: hypothetical protein VJB93_02245 [Patescibacteria group bacterium]|nr:hypothetical protein [Patescibacteria group bacterium]